VRGFHSPPSVVADALTTLGLQDLADASPGELSQGQRKLVGVARALAARPRIICLDEPPPAWTPRRAPNSAAACVPSPTPGPHCFSSTTTWAW